MRKLFFVIGYSLIVICSVAQTINQKLQKAFTAFEKDSQLKHAISSLYVIDAQTGQVVFDKNSQIGLAPASTQKIITSITAFELLGKDYRYKTSLGHRSKIINKNLKGDIYLIGTGDPTLGSWRYTQTKDSTIFKTYLNGIKDLGIEKVDGRVIGDLNRYSPQTIPDGWIWQDIGNYYGAPANGINWKENQKDIVLRSGNIIGEKVEVITEINVTHFRNDLHAAAKGTGDNAYVYLWNGREYVISGTIPINESAFRISINDPDKIQELEIELGNYLKSKGIIGAYLEPSLRYPQFDTVGIPFQEIAVHYSPTLDSIIYWFNKKSVNLYGEALIKTFAYEKNGFGSTDSGVAIVKKFWKEKGVDEDELGIVDGSGLSPLNRVTTHAQVEILKYAKTKDWFPYFKNALPEYNGMSMKSGTIRGVKGFCGYHKAKNGKEYIFSFLVNNYNGSASALVNKMYNVLDILK